MKILALDVSTKTGWALFDTLLANPLVKYGNILVKIEEFNVMHPEKSLKYPYNMVDAADKLANLISNLCIEHNPDIVIIENTVKGKNRHTQRVLEFFHKSILDLLRKFKVQYVNPSDWRSNIGMVLSPDDVLNNKLVSKGKKRGRITKKHLAVRYVKERFNIDLLMKQNDIADAICIGYSHVQSNLS